MKKLKLQNLALALTGLWMLFFTISVFTGHEEEAEAPLELLESKSEIQARENVQSRREYELLRQADPESGLMPVDVRKNELDFARDQYAKTQLLQLQKGVEGADSEDDTDALNWSAIGPENFGGRTRALAIDVRDENILLAGGVSGGVWRSTDGGQSWTKTITPEQLHSVTNIVQDTRAGQEDTWYFGTGELVGNSARARGAPFRGDGIYKSTDGGLTWAVLPSTRTNDPAFFNSPFNYVWDMVLNPNNLVEDEIIAAVFGGLVRSVDGGLTWSTVLGDDLLGLGTGIDTDLNEIATPFYTDVHRATDGVFYGSLSSITSDPEALAVSGGVYFSTNGVDWTRFSNVGQIPTRRIELGSSPSNPDDVYFIQDGQASYRLQKFNRSTFRVFDLSDNIPDGGDGIEEFDSQGSYDLFVRVHPTNPNIVYLGGTNLYRSTDAFETSNNITWIGGYDPEDDGASIYPGHHPDQHDLIFLPSNSNVALSANDGGIFKTFDILAGEVEYQSLNNGFVTTQYYTGFMSRLPSDDFTIGGLQDNGSIITFDQFAANNGTRVIGGDGAWAASTRFGIYYYMSFQNGRVFRLSLDPSDFSLTDFARVDPVGGGSDPGQPYLFINPFILDPNNQNRMYLAGGDFVWRNRNLSQVPSRSQQPTSFNWAQLADTEIPDGQISAIEVSAEPANIVYYGSSIGRLFRIDDAHADTYQVTDITADDFPNFAYISSISANPVNANEIVVTFSNYRVQSVFHSTDGGSTFTAIGGNLEEAPDGEGNGPSVRWARVVPKNSGPTEYFLATSTGVYSTSALNGASTVWELEGPNTIGNVVTNMVDYRRSDGKVVAATHGRGMFTSQISDVVPPPTISVEGGLQLEPPFPNPFSSDVTLPFNLPETGFIFVRVYNSSGQLIKVIARGQAFEGINEIFWDGTNSIGNPVPPGVYLIRFTYNNENVAERVILTR